MVKQGRTKQNDSYRNRIRFFTKWPALISFLCDLLMFSIFTCASVSFICRDIYDYGSVCKGCIEPDSKLAVRLSREQIYKRANIQSKNTAKKCCSQETLLVRMP